MSITYIIIEDNPGAIENLQIELKKYSHLNELGVANNRKEGVALALKKLPNIIFLDIELGDENGFKILQEIKQRSLRLPCFIITTDHLKYGKEAVNREALYFLDKPIDPEELEAAITKVESYLKKNEDCLVVKNSEGNFFISLSDIQYIESKNNYCTIYRNNYPPFTVSRTLRNLETVLPDKFLRIHNSYIVNQKCVQMMNTTKKIIQFAIEENCTTKTVTLPIGNIYLAKVRFAMLGNS